MSNFAGQAHLDPIKKMGMKPLRFYFTIFFGGLTALTLFLSTVLNLHRPRAHAFEMFCILILAGVVLRSRKFRGVLQSVHPVYAFVLSFIVLASIWAQSLDESGATYPFVSWTMYTGREPAPVYYEYLAVHENGESSPLIWPEHALRIRTFQGQLTKSLYLEKDERHPQHEELPYSYEELVHGLLRMRRGASRNPIQYVDAFKVELPPSFTGGEEAKTITHLRRVKIDL